MILLKLTLKEIKQFFRNKTDVITMFIFPIVLIFVIGIALNGLMNVEKNIFEGKNIYYSKNNLGEDEIYINAFNKFKSSFEEITNTQFVEIDSKDSGKKAVDTGKAMVFININSKNFSMYRGKNRESSEQKIFKSVFEQYLNKYALSTVVMNEANNQSSSQRDIEELEKILNEKSNVKVVKEGISSSGISSYTYYTFVELVLVILYISSITSMSMHKEYYLNTMSRFRVSRVSHINIILSKSILGVMIGILQIIVVYIVSTVFLKVDWGDNIPQIIIVLIGLIIFSSIMGIVSSLVFKDQKTAAIASNMIIIIMGFLGGSYLPISLVKSIDITNLLCKFTPTYWANISLLSLSSGISTNYPKISLIVSLGLSILMLLVVFILNKLKVGGKNA